MKAKIKPSCKTCPTPLLPVKPAVGGFSANLVNMKKSLVVTF